MIISLDSFFIKSWLLTSDNWIKQYIFWELELLKLLGYDLELKKMVEKEIINDQFNYYVSSSKEKKIVPNFLIDKKINVNDLKILKNGLALVTNYLEKTILKPNNLPHPISRLQFINILK